MIQNSPHELYKEKNVKPNYFPLAVILLNLLKNVLF